MTQRTAQTLHTRRAFLRTSILGAAASWTLPVFLEKTFFTLNALAADSPLQTVTGKDNTILVVLQMAGGNDGLNTVVPFADDAYYNSRPVIGLAAKNVLKLNDYAGLNPKLAGLKALFDDGHLSVIQGVGYPNPNRSHFRSTEIWQTAADSEKMEAYGWIGRYFDSCCKGADPTVGVNIGNEMPQSFSAHKPIGVSFSRPEQYRWNSKETQRDELFRQLNQVDESTGTQANDGGSIGAISGTQHSNMGALDFLQRTALDAQISSNKISEIAKKYHPAVEYPRNQLADSLSLVARMIAGGLPTRVYYVSQGGYDTHTNQVNTHDRLMSELGDAVGAFCKDLQAQNNFDRVLLMTFSEFGRRVAQNGSNGTDHGAAAPMFMAGGGAKAGLFGQYPSLTKLSDGDLIHTVDFRSVYATVLDKWLGAPSELVLGRKFPLLPIV